LDRFDEPILKIIFLKKHIILIHFNIKKNTLKNTHKHISKHNLIIYIIFALQAHLKEIRGVLPIFPCAAILWTSSWLAGLCCFYFGWLLVHGKVNSIRKV